MKTWAIAVIGLLIQCRAEDQKVEPDFMVTLQSVTQTNRISSNHFCDMVVDANGTAYLASFRKVNGPLDEIYITGIDVLGEKKFEIGAGNTGRGMAIALGQNSIYATGHFEDLLYLTPCALLMGSGNSVFIAEIDLEGNCQQMIGGEGQAMATDIACSKNEVLLLGGIMGKSLKFGEKVLTNSTATDRGFLALFDAQDLVCKSLVEFSGQVTRIRSFDESFTVSGFFVDSLVVGNKVFDRREGGFKVPYTMMLDREMNVVWTEVCPDCFGQITDAQVYGQVIYRLCTTQHLGEGSETLRLEVLNSEGELISSEPLIHPFEDGRIATIQPDDMGVWIATTVGENASWSKPQVQIGAKDDQCLIFHQSNTGAIDQIIMPGHGSNTLIRSGQKTSDGEVVFSGHFQTKLKINQDSLSNDGGHEIFLLRMKRK